MKNSPLVSICVLTYNHEEFIQETLLGLINQEYENLEIIISDDNSTDSTFHIIQKFASEYAGVHKLIINKNEQNMGLVPHINMCLFELAHGDYIMLHGGDDISLSNRVIDSLKLMNLLSVDSISLNMQFINEKSVVTGKKFYINEDNDGKYDISDYITGRYKQVPGASRMISRRLLDTFGPLNNDAQSEDTPLNFRALLLSGVGFSAKNGLLYRIHSNNASSFLNLHTRFDIRKIFNQYYTDLERALSLNLISEKQYLQVKDILNHKLTIEIACKDIFVADGILGKIGYLKKYLRQNIFSINEKKMLFRFFLSCVKRQLLKY